MEIRATWNEGEGKRGEGRGGEDRCVFMAGNKSKVSCLNIDLVDILRS